MSENLTHEALLERIKELEKAESRWNKTKENFDTQKKSYKVLMDISSNCINIPLDEVESAIQISLEEIGKFVSADRAYIFKYDFDRRIGINTYEWCADEIEPQIQNLQESPIDAFGEWVESHQKGDPVIINMISDLPAGQMKGILTEQQIKSLLSVPMFEDEFLVGFSGFDSVRKPHNYTQNEIDIIRIFGRIIVSLNLRSNRDKERKQIITDLQEAVDNVKALSGLLPICAKCKKIRDDKGYWNELEAYLETHSDLLFTHGICTGCMEKLYGAKKWFTKRKK